VTGREANEKYGVLVIQELLRHGSYPFYVGSSFGTLIAPSGGPDRYDYDYDTAAVVRYRSRRDFLEIFRDSNKVGLTHKIAAIHETVVVCTSPGIFISDILIVVVLLLIMILP
jgi:hypothetical protein